MLHSFSHFSKAILFASSLLCVSAPVFASKALYPCTDADLVEQGRDPAFNNVIWIFMKKLDVLSSCSAAKVRIPERTTPLYATAAHCLEGALSAWDRTERAVIRSTIHPFYALNPLADMAFFEIEGDTLNDGYLLYQGDAKFVPPQSLVSVGYGGKEAENGTFSRRSFYAGKVVFDAFSINQQRDGVYPEEDGMCRGVVEHGDSGGPLFVKREDGAYEIVGITSRTSFFSCAIGHIQWARIDYTRWARMDLHFVESIVKSPEAVGEYMLVKSGKTRQEMATILQNDPLVQYAWGAFQKERNGDDTQVFGWYMKAANQGHAAAQFKLGEMYRRGQGVMQSDKKAIKWYEKAADQGYAPAQYDLGVMYENGRGVTQNDKEAIKWYTLSANQGYASAQYNLGCMYYQGPSFMRNYIAATQWFTLASNQDYALAQYNLGVMYEKGVGVAQDYGMAIKLYALAANQGYALAQYNLGVMYAQGWGVVGDIGKAIKWFTLAANQGDEMAKEALGIIKARAMGKREL